ncbi:MAG: hypothetical protein VSS75_023710 [Candidatus Parabeggiatoa sp.]|nr:hypothetical protein [Candidatus Parabeggiatoa sp.]
MPRVSVFVSMRCLASLFLFRGNASRLCFDAMPLRLCFEAMPRISVFVSRRGLAVSRRGLARDAKHRVSTMETIPYPFA